MQSLIRLLVNYSNDQADIYLIVSMATESTKRTLVAPDLLATLQINEVTIFKRDLIWVTVVVRM